MAELLSSVTMRLIRHMNQKRLCVLTLWEGQMWEAKFSKMDATEPAWSGTVWKSTSLNDAIMGAAKLFEDEETERG